MTDESQNSSPQTKSPPEASRILSHLSASNRARRTSSESESLNSGSPNDSGIESKPSFSSKADDLYTRKSGGNFKLLLYTCNDRLFTENNLIWQLSGSTPGNYYHYAEKYFELHP